MTLGTLLPPITAATILNIFVFAGLWKATKVEKRTGRTPWYLSLTIFVYFAPITAFAYFARDRMLSGALDTFVVALLSQALGAGIVYALVQGFIATRGDTPKERAPMIAAGVFLLFVIVVATLKTA